MVASGPVKPKITPLGRVLFALAIVLLALAATAQPRKDKPGKKVEADAPVATEPAPAAAPTATDDLGAPPPKPAPGSEKVTPSPLNPAANEFAEAKPRPPPESYDKLMGEIAALRGRVAALTTTLFSSKLRVEIETDDHDAARITKLVVTLDDGVVYVAPARFSAEDAKVVYEHAVAPGHHVLGVEVERTDARGREYQSWQATKTSIVVPEGKRVVARVVIEDDSDMAKDFPEDQDGTYELNFKVRARVQ